MTTDLDGDELSMVTIGGRRFPACRLICPISDGQDPAEDRLLGGRSKFSVDAYIPLESGVLVHVTQQESDGRLDCGLYARTCELEKFVSDGDVALWLPITLTVLNGLVFPWPGPPRGVFHWARCEEWWLVEHLDRVSAMSYVEPDGPACELIGLERPEA